MSTRTRRRLVVVGGGVTGLAAAWEASSDPSVEVTVLESADRIGGKIRTSTIDVPHTPGSVHGAEPVPIDEGPDNFLARVPHAVELCEELGLGDELIEPAASRAGVWIDGTVVFMPAGTVLGVPFDFEAVASSGILTPEGLARARSELDHDWPAPTSDVSIGGFLAERYGDEVVERLVSPLVGGINAGNVHRLSMQAVTPQLWAAAARGGSLSRALAEIGRRTSPSTSTGGRPPAVFRALRGGSGTMITALRDRLDERGVTVRTRTLVHSFEPVGAGAVLTTSAGPIDADMVVLATPIARTADIVDGIDTSVARCMRTVHSASVTMATLVYPADSFPEIEPSVSGILVPRSAGLATTAISFGSHKWPHWGTSGGDRTGSTPAAATVLRISAGHVDDAASAALADDDLVDRLTSETAMLTGTTAVPTTARITRWTGAFPQYQVGHPDLVDRITSELWTIAPMVRVAGASYRGLGIPACIDSGRTAVRELLA